MNKIVRNEKIKIFLLGVLCTTGLFLLAGAAQNDRGGVMVSRNSPEVGRYQVSVCGENGTVYVIDTMTGVTKRVKSGRQTVSQAQVGIPFDMMKPAILDR